MTRDVTDKNGNVIGQLSLPDDTSEDVWTQKLAELQYTNPIPTQNDVIAKQVAASFTFGRNLLMSIATTNISNGIVQSGKMRACLDYGSNLQLFLATGALPAALQEIDALVAAGVPDNLAPFITVGTLTGTRQTIAAFLGVS